MEIFSEIRDWRFWRRHSDGMPEQGLARCWWSGFLNCMPANLRRLLIGSNERLVVEPQGQLASVWLEGEGGRTELVQIDLEAAAPVPLGSVKQPEKLPVELRLPADAVLRRRISLPASVAENLRQVVGFEMDRLTPFDRAQVFYDCHILQREPDRKKIKVELVLARRDRVEPWLEALQKARLSPTIVAPAVSWADANLLPVEQRGGNGGRTRMIQLSVLGGLVLLLIAGLMFSPLLQKKALVESLSSELSTARRQATQVTALREELETTRESARYVLDQRLKQPPVLDVLREVTRLLPDDTWTQQLELKRDRLQLRGESTQALGLIARLEASPMFEEVVFLSPVVQIAGRQGKERFHISARITEPHLEQGAKE